MTTHMIFGWLEGLLWADGWFDGVANDPHVSGSSIRRMVARMPAPRYLGRDGELRVLGGALDDAALGRMTGVIIESEAGIGRSRLLSEGLVAAHDRGVYLGAHSSNLWRSRSLTALAPRGSTRPFLPFPSTNNSQC